MGYSRNIKTEDNAKSPALQTRYFKDTYYKVNETLKSFAHANQFEVATENTDFKELLLKKGKLAITCSMIQVSPTTIAVDLVILRRPVDFMNIPLPDFNKCEHTAELLYSYLEKNLSKVKG